MISPKSEKRFSQFGQFSTWGLASPSIKDLFAVIIILGSVFFLSWKGIRDKSNTVDEVAHVMSGHTYWKLNDYRMTPESGILSDRIAALPLQFGLDGRPVDTSTEKWAQSAQWKVAKDWWFLSENNPHEILRLSRKSMLSFNLLGIGLVFLLSSSLWGRGAGYLSLILAGFSPNFLGHMPLATSDFALAWTLVLASVSYGWLADKITIWRILLAGLTAGMAILSKQSGLLFGPVAILIFSIRILDKSSLSFVNRSFVVTKTRLVDKAGLLLLASLSAAVISWLAIWTAYGWRFHAANQDVGTFSQFQVAWETLKNESVLAKWVFVPCRNWHLLPEAYLYGIDFIQSKINRGGFLNGVYSPDGYRLFYLWNFLYKTPPPAIILHLFGWVSFAILLIKRRSIKSPELISLICLSFIYVLVLLTTRMNLGYRHAFPVLMVSCIISGLTFKNSLGKSPLACALMTGLALSLIPYAWMNSNRFISYMNFIGGGNSKGFHNLSDSSLDWGQDLPAAADYIKQWRTTHPEGEVYLCAFGTVLPQAYGLKNTNHLPFWGFSGRSNYLPSLDAGLYVISSTAMAQMYSGWGRQEEIDYRMVKNSAIPIYEKLEAEDKLYVTEADAILSEEEKTTLEVFEIIRFRRLITYLRARKTDAVINGSIPVYQLTQSELDDLSW